MPVHPLHQLVGEAIAKAIPAPFEVVRDSACGGKQAVPLFSSAEKAKATEYCNVDVLVLSPNGVKIIVEIEEADITPIQICGKFLASALSRYFIHEREQNVRIGMSDSVVFIQVLDTSSLKRDKTAKIQQWKNIERSIQAATPIKGSRITQYELLYGDGGDFSPDQTGRKKLIDRIQAHLAE